MTHESFETEYRDRRLRSFSDKIVETTRQNPLFVVVQSIEFADIFPSRAQTGFSPRIRGSALMAKWIGRLFRRRRHSTDIAASNLRVATQALRYRLCSTLGAMRRVACRPRLVVTIDYVAVQTDLGGVPSERRCGVAVAVVHAAILTSL